LASSSKANPPLLSAYTKAREIERDVYHSDAKFKEVCRPCFFSILCIDYPVQLTGLSSSTRHKDLLQISSAAVSDVPLPAPTPSDQISPAQKVRAGQGASNTNDIPKPSELSQPVMRPYPTRTDGQILNHIVRYPSVHLTATHPTPGKAQLDLPSYLPNSSAVVHADAPAKQESTTEVSSFSKLTPKDAGFGSRNTLPITNFQASSGYNISPFVQAPSNHVQTYGQPTTSKLVEAAQLVSRHDVTSTESHIDPPHTENLMLPMSNRIQPNLASSVPEPPVGNTHNTASEHELISSIKIIPRDDGLTSLRNAHLAGNAQDAIEIGQKAPPPPQNQSNPTQSQV
jgi:hypothetical protein